MLSTATASRDLRISGAPESSAAARATVSIIASGSGASLIPSALGLNCATPAIAGCDGIGSSVANRSLQLADSQLTIKRRSRDKNPMSEQREYRVDVPCELMAFLLGPPLRLARARAKKLLKFQAVSVRGHRRVRHDTALVPGDIVTIGGARRSSDSILERVGLRIVHLDDAIIVIDKR